MNMSFQTSIVVVLFFCCFQGIVHCDSPIETASENANQSCLPSESECTFGCCPFAQGVCCIDGFECCQRGQICIPIIGVCLGAVNNDGDVSLTSSKPTSVRSSALDCPFGWTECEPDKCCPFSEGVCCPGSEYCCPNGYRCDVPHKKCMKDTKVNRRFYIAAALDKPITKLSKKSAYKSCPGGDRMCPNFTNCCVNDNGEWECCPKPFLPQAQYGSGE